MSSAEGSPSTVGRYQILERIGGGGMGVVYRAYDPDLHCEVCIKQTRDDSPEFRKLFLREARAASQLQGHPNVAHIYNIDVHEGRPFIVMELVQGRTLEPLIAEIRAGAPINLARRLHLMDQLCAGLAAAHKKEIVHRDIKPANLMSDERDVLKIVDFGIARISGLSESIVAGTLNYMAPERWTADGSGDWRSDIFSAGAVFYELLSGQRAFPGKEVPEVYRMIVDGAPAPLEEWCPSLDQGIVQIVNKMLQRRPDDRYQSLEPVQERLERLRRKLTPAEEAEFTRTIRVVQPDADVRPVVTSNRTPRPSHDREAFARKRAAKIELHAQAARQAFDEGDYERVLVACEQVLELDPEHSVASDLLDRGRAALDRREADRFLVVAGEHRQRGALDEAAAAVERALALAPDATAALRLRDEIQTARVEAQRAHERAAAIQRSMARVHASIDAGRLEDALRDIASALELDPGHQDAVRLRSLVLRLLADRDQPIEPASPAADPGATRRMPRANPAPPQESAPTLVQVLDQPTKRITPLDRPIQTTTGRRFAGSRSAIVWLVGTLAVSGSAILLVRLQKTASPTLVPTSSPLSVPSSYNDQIVDEAAREMSTARQNAVAAGMVDTARFKEAERAEETARTLRLQRTPEAVTAFWKAKGLFDEARNSAKAASPASAAAPQAEVRSQPATRDVPDKNIPAAPAAAGRGITGAAFDRLLVTEAASAMKNSKQAAVAAAATEQPKFQEAAAVQITAERLERERNPDTVTAYWKAKGFYDEAKSAVPTTASGFNAKIVSEASSEMTASRQSAMAAGAADQPKFRDAALAQSAAERLEQERNPEAVTTFWKAKGLYDEAASAAQSKPAAPPVAARGNTRPADSPSAPLDPRVAITQVLRRYQDAFQAMDTKALLLVYPGFAGANELQKRFADLREVALALGTAAIQMTSATSAVATCTYSQTYTSKTGKVSNTPPQRAEFRLRNDGTNWLIDGLTFK